MDTLHLKYRKHVKAGNGVAGEGGRRTGAQGEDVILEVPLGTIARDPESSEKLAEITEDGQEIILFPGGRGGLGMTILNQLPNKLPTMPSQVNQARKNGLFLS